MGTPTDDLIAIARSEFSELPKHSRGSARVKNLQVRFYIDKFVEHESAFHFLADSKQTYGEGPKTLIRALLFYEEDVVQRLEAERAGGRQPNTELRLAMLDFTPQRKRRTSRVKGVSARLYIDQISEHRRAYKFLQAQQSLHGDGNKTVIRALNHYKKKVIDPLHRQTRGELF